MYVGNHYVPSRLGQLVLSVHIAGDYYGFDLSFHVISSYLRVIMVAGTYLNTLSNSECIMPL